MSNIGIDASRAFKKEKTGVEWYAYNIIKNLLKIDSRNQYILYSQNSSINFLDPQVPPIRRAGKPENDNMRWKKLKWPFKYFWTQGRLSLEMLLNKPDTLFIPASAMPIIHPKNTVVAIHDVGFMKYPEAYSKWQRIYLKWSTKFAIKHAKSIITISEFSKQEIIKYFTNTSPSPLLGREGSNLEDKIFITPLACDTEKFKVITDQNKIQTILKKYNINSPYILFTGRLETKKNILNIVKAFAEFNTSPDSASLRHPLLIRRG